MNRIVTIGKLHSADTAGLVRLAHWLFLPARASREELVARITNAIGAPL
jgi:hypothetical protein